MAVAPFAQWKPLPAGVNHSAGGMVAWDGVVLHIMEGILDGTDSWFRNPQAQASAHFGVGRDGRIYQWVDTRDKAWAQAEGNPRNISIENEGFAGDSLTQAQVEGCAMILAWARTVHGVPLRVNDSPTAQGLGWHGMGGSAWGGHTGCPGDLIRAQRTAIVTRAGQILKPQPVPQPQPSGGNIVKFNPPLQVGAHQTFAVVKPAAGGAYEITPDGHVYAWGCPDIGMPAGQPYWGARTVFDVLPLGANGFTVLGFLNGKQDGRYDYAGKP